MPSPELVGEGGGEGEVGEQVDCAAEEERGVLNNMEGFKYESDTS